MGKLLRSMSWAKKGLLTVLKEEDNFQVEILISIAVIVLGVIVHLSQIEWIFICISITIVLSAEIINTAIEDLCNKIEPNQDETIGKIKDMMAAFVLTLCIGSVIIGIVIFTPHFF